MNSEPVSDSSAERQDEAIPPYATFKKWSLKHFDGYVTSLNILSQRDTKTLHGYRGKLQNRDYARQSRIRNKRRVEALESECKRLKKELASHEKCDNKYKALVDAIRLLVYPQAAEHIISYAELNQ